MHKKLHDLKGMVFVFKRTLFGERNMPCSRKKVSTLGVLEPIFNYFPSMGSRKQENHYKIFVFFQSLSSLPQSFHIEFFN